MTTLVAVLMLSAWGSEPDAAVEDDGTIVVSVAVAASAAEINGILSDVTTDLGSDSRVVARVPRGDCEVVTRETRGIFRPFRFTALRCPTSSGWSEELTDSSDFSAYEAAWHVDETASGTQVTYRVRTELNHALPSAVVRHGVLSGAKNAVATLVKKVLGKKTK